MKTATVFINGHSTQAVRIPKSYRFTAKEVWIVKKENSLIITPKPTSWDDFFTSDLKVTDDFDMKRSQQVSQKRNEQKE